MRVGIGWETFNPLENAANGAIGVAKREVKIQRGKRYGKARPGQARPGKARQGKARG